MDGRGGVIAADVRRESHLRAVHPEDFYAVACAAPTRNIDALGVYNSLRQRVERCLVDRGQHLGVFLSHADSFSNSIHLLNLLFSFSGRLRRTYLCSSIHHMEKTDKWKNRK